ncbi:helix-turn-helix domain-containing protein [Chitinophaga sp. NPDC101104]|uniref:helix-turn-helix domain-containing protein n=1 Tax=Chitinophaga sp. NPDC101104 TaxID=3390561 RepID=UPI003CFFDB89
MKEANGSGRNSNPQLPWITLEDLQKFKGDLLKEIEALLQAHLHPQQKKWLKSYEVRKLLNLSPGTLQTLRDNGTLPYTKMGGALYYDYKDIEKLMEKEKVVKRWMRDGI